MQLSRPLSHEVDVLQCRDRLFCFGEPTNVSRFEPLAKNIMCTNSVRCNIMLSLSTTSRAVFQRICLSDMHAQLTSVDSAMVIRILRALCWSSRPVILDCSDVLRLCSTTLQYADISIIHHCCNFATRSRRMYGFLARYRAI